MERHPLYNLKWIVSVASLDSVDVEIAAIEREDLAQSQRLGRSNQQA